MFGSKGPRSKSGRGPTRSAPASRSSSVLETVVVETSSRRPAGRGPAVRVAGEPQVAKSRLIDLASDWLSTALALGQIPELPDANAIRARALELKSRFERESAAQGFTAADTEEAVFAMVAFLDETVLNSRGAARDTWVARPLQLELYGRQLAGEEFFERLERLRHERESRIEALEVLYCCLAFGFAGRYRLFPEKLPALIEEVQHDVAAIRGSGASDLAPNAGRRNERVDEERRGMPWWMPALAFLGAVVVAWLLIFLFARIGAGHAASSIAGLSGR